MTNNEMMQSDLLDILFENRNKDYGAYALRRGYDHRLLVSLGIAMALIIALIGLSSFSKRSVVNARHTIRKDSIILTTHIIPKEKLKLPDIPNEKPKTIEKPVKPEASVKYTDNIRIVPAEKLSTVMPSTEEMVEKIISTTSADGEKPTGLVTNIVKPLDGSGNGGGTGTDKPRESFIPLERNAEYPGGPEALRRFLSGNLATPDELEAGQKMMVRIRFNIDKDGNISSLEIEHSGGDKYDREVIRVCKKMPRWKPALQNGVNVPVSYVLPVTFIGQEQ